MGPIGSHQEEQRRMRRDRPRFVSLPPSDSAIEQVLSAFEYLPLLRPRQPTEQVQHADRPLVRLVDAAMPRAAERAGRGDLA